MDHCRTRSETAPVDGVITSLDVSSIPLAEAIREATIDETIVRDWQSESTGSHLTIESVDADGNQAEMRKTFYLQIDPNLKAGFL